MAAQPAQDESDVSLRICSRDNCVHLLSKNWRRGQESNLPRLLRTDNGFEDREGHQAPFTLRKAEKQKTESGKSEPDWRLFELFDLANDLVEVRPVTGFEFGMEQFAIGANFKCAAARRNERERFDAFAEFKNFGRQTDGLRRVVSNDAIFDRDFGFHPVRSFPTKMVGSWREPVKMSILRGARNQRLRVEAGASPPASAPGPPPPK